jgi:tetratricopeptide (TPR) repeat protein
MNSTDRHISVLPSLDLARIPRLAPDRRPPYIERDMALSRKKAILFSIIPATLLLLLLVLTEVALRVFVPSLSSPLFIRTSDTMIEVNREYLEKFFPASSVLIPELKPAKLQYPKPPGLFRVVCLGGSSMFGVPYEMTANIPGIFRKQLRHSMPGKEVEVINLASSAINSNVIKDLAEKSLSLQPDLILLYMGHNEFYGPDGIGVSFLERHLPFLTGWKYGLRDVRIVRLVQRWLHSAAMRSMSEQNLMRQVSNDAWVALNSRDAQRIFGTYTDNLREILSTFERERIPVLVSDVSSNLMFPPFAYADLPPMHRIPDAALSGHLQEAGSLVQQLMAGDSTNAFLWYWRGRLDLAAGRADAARLALSRARDLDMLKFRAPERINEITRRVCHEMHIPCVSTDTLFDALSPEGIPGFNLFWEHLHPKVHGYYDIAELFFREAARRRLIPHPEEVAQSILPFNTDTLGICWLDLAYGDLSMRGLTSRWPFQDLRVEPLVFPSSPEKIKQIALEVYEKKMGWSEGLLKSAAEFHRLGMYRAAATTYEAMLDEYSEGYYTRYLLGTVLKDSGDVAGAAMQYAASIRLNHEYPYARVDLGLIEINRGNLDAAQAQLTTALELSSKQESPKTLQASIYYGLAAVAANRGEYEAALLDLDRSLQLSPSYTPARMLREALERKR